MITHPICNINNGANGSKHQNMVQFGKIASFQKFVPHDFDACDYGTSRFPVAAVHRIGILDVCILNVDRHAGNILVRKLDDGGRFGLLELVPIDHGLCLPESLEDPYFEWIHWPQTSISFSEDELEYIAHLDPVRDSEMLRMELPMIREACLRVLVVCTIFLKEAADLGLCLAEIGEMMSRGFQGHEEEPSELEVICLEAKKPLEEIEACYPEKSTHKVFQFDLGCAGELDVVQNSEVNLVYGPSVHHGFKVGNGYCLVSELVEAVSIDGRNQEEERETEGNKKPSKQDQNGVLIQSPALAVSKLSKSLKTISLGEQSWQHPVTTPKGNYLAGTTSGNRSANEQLPTSPNFVKLADMNLEEWALFLENFRSFCTRLLPVIS